MGSRNPRHHRQTMIAAVTGAVATVATAQATPPPVASKDAGAAPVDYWTPARMRDAKPIPLPAPAADAQTLSRPETDGGQQASPSNGPGQLER